MNTFCVTKNQETPRQARFIAPRQISGKRGKHLCGKRLHARRRGSTLIEFALVLPLLLLLTMAIIQYGIIMNATNTLSQITREGARYAAINPGSGSAADNQKIKDYMDQVSRPTSVRYNDFKNNITITTPDGINKGNRIVVTVVYPMSKKVFMIGKIMGVKFFADNYTTASTFAIE